MAEKRVFNMKVPVGEEGYVRAQAEGTKFEVRPDGIRVYDGDSLVAIFPANAVLSSEGSVTVTSRPSET